MIQSNKDKTPKTNSADQFFKKKGNISAPAFPNQNKISMSQNKNSNINL